MKRRKRLVSTPPARKISPRRIARSGRPGKLGIVRLYGPQLGVLRRECFERDGGVCQWPIVGGICGKPLIYRRGFIDSMHMAHIVGHGRGGSDVLENVRALCRQHHLVDEHNPKPCPPKPRDY